MILLGRFGGTRVGTNFFEIRLALTYSRKINLRFLALLNGLEKGVISLSRTSSYNSSSIRLISPILPVFFVLMFFKIGK